MVSIPATSAAVDPCSEIAESDGVQCLKPRFARWRLRGAAAEFPRGDSAADGAVSFGHIAPQPHWSKEVSFISRPPRSRMGLSSARGRTLYRPIGEVRRPNCPSGKPKLGRKFGNASPSLSEFMMDEQKILFDLFWRFFFFYLKIVLLPMLSSKPDAKLQNFLSSSLSSPPPDLPFGVELEHNLSLSTEDLNS